MPESNEPRESIEERRKKKRIEKLEKRIKVMQTRQEKQKAPRRNPEKFEREVSEIRNKHKRQEMVLRKRGEKNSGKKLVILKRRKLREELGEEAVPKGEALTIEKMRVPDETMIEDAEDEDLIGEANIDEFDAYFKRETTPKILVTTNRRPNGVSEHIEDIFFNSLYFVQNIFPFLKEIKTTIPNVEYYPRKGFKIKDIIEMSKDKKFTDIMVFQEKNGKPHSLILSHLPEGPTATFRVSGVKLNHEIKGHGANNGMMVAPELILNNFDTMLGSRVGRMIAALFPQDPQLEKRRVITWHN